MLPKGVHFLHMSFISRFLEKTDAGSFHRWIMKSILNVTYSKKTISIALLFRSFLNKFASFIKVFKNF